MGPSGFYFATAARFALLAVSGLPRIRPCYTARLVEAPKTNCNLAAERIPARRHQHRNAKLRLRDLQCFPVIGLIRSVAGLLGLIGVTGASAALVASSLAHRNGSQPALIWGMAVMLASPDGYAQCRPPSALPCRGDRPR